MIDPVKQPASMHARIRARRTAVQALYQWEMNRTSMAELISEFMDERSELKKADTGYFCELVNGASKNIDTLEELIIPCLDRTLTTLDPIERAILLIGAYELNYRPELPWRVVINESIELAKMFGAEQSHKYINGVMEKIARNVRGTEIRDAS